MGKELIGERIDWDKMAKYLEDSFNLVVKTTENERYSSGKLDCAIKATEIANALVRVSAEQRAVVKDQRERARTQPNFNKPRD
jgi:hypothetical protein